MGHQNKVYLYISNLQFSVSRQNTMGYINVVLREN